jgi:tetratricopeptide (TPR) repeat protein
MASSKFGANLAFALFIAALGLTAVTFIYVNSHQLDNRPAAAQAESGAQLPENHPNIDVASQLTALNRLIVREPQNPDYRVQLANIYYDLGQYDKAVESYQQSLNLRPNDPNVETDLATCFHYLGQNDKALEMLDKVLKYNPGFPQALFNKGIVLVAGKKDAKGAISVWEDLLRSDPNFPQKAELERRIGHLKESVK